MSLGALGSLGSGFSRLGALGGAVAPIRRVVATKGFYPGVASNAVGILTNGTTQLSETSRTWHVLGGAAANGVQLVYENSVNAPGETAGPNSITVKAAIETGGTTFPVLFSGSRIAAIASGGELISDPVANLPFAILAGFWVRTFVSVTSGQKWPIGRLVVFPTLGEGTNRVGVAGAPGGTTGADHVDETGSTNIMPGGGTAFAYAPSAILGLTTNAVPRVGVVSDSIGSGVGDTNVGGNVGWVEKILAPNNIPFISAARSSDTANNWLTNHTFRVRLLSLGISSLLDTLGTNDVVGAWAGQTIATIQANQIAAWQLLTGVAYYKATIPPRTTDGTNTVIANAAGNANRLLLNTWLRDGAPVNASLVAVAVGTSAPGTLRAGMTGHPLKGVIDMAIIVEDPNNPGFWLAGFVALDGVHPPAVAVTAIVASINPNVFV